MKHEEYAKQLYSLVDNLLTVEEEEEIREHLSNCEICSDLHKSLVSDDVALKKGLESLASAEDLEERVLDSVTRLREIEHETRLRFPFNRFFWSRRFAYAAMIFIIFSAALGLGTWFVRERSMRFGQIAMVKGLAWCKRDGLQFLLKTGDLLRRGDEVFTDSQGKVHILTVNYSILILNEKTDLRIEGGNERQKLDLARGQIFIDSGENCIKYSISTPASEIQNIGTKFDIAVTGNQFIPSVLHVIVEKGQAIVKTDDGSFDVKTGEKITFVENRVAKFEKMTSLDEITKWRWNVKKLDGESPMTKWEEKDPYTDRKWTMGGRRFAVPEDEEAEEYTVMTQLQSAMWSRFGRPTEISSVEFSDEYIYFGTTWGIFRYNRSSKTISLIIPDYGIIGSEITEIAVSESGDVFDITFRRPGSNLIERLVINADSFPMILSVDLRALGSLAMAR